MGTKMATEVDDAMAQLFTEFLLLVEENDADLETVRVLFANRRKARATAERDHELGGIADRVDAAYKAQRKNPSKGFRERVREAAWGYGEPALESDVDALVEGIRSTSNQNTANVAVGALAGSIIHDRLKASALEPENHPLAALVDEEQTFSPGTVHKARKAAAPPQTPPMLELLHRLVQVAKRLEADHFRAATGFGGSAGKVDGDIADARAFIANEFSRPAVSR